MCVWDHQAYFCWAKQSNTPGTFSSCIADRQQHWEEACFPFVYRCESQLKLFWSSFTFRNRVKWSAIVGFIFMEWPFSFLVSISSFILEVFSSSTATVQWSQLSHLKMAAMANKNFKMIKGMLNMNSRLEAVILKQKENMDSIKNLIPPIDSGKLQYKLLRPYINTLLRPQKLKAK